MKIVVVLSKKHWYKEAKLVLILEICIYEIYTQLSAKIIFCVTEFIIGIIY